MAQVGKEHLCSLRLVPQGHKWKPSATTAEHHTRTRHHFGPWIAGTWGLDREQEMDIVFGIVVNGS